MKNFTFVVLIVFFMTRRQYLGWSLMVGLILPFVLVLLLSLNRKEAIKEHIKHNVLATLDSSAVTVLRFSTIDLDQVIDWENEFEFTYNRILYDIVRIDTIDDEVVIWCWPDHQENQINTLIQQLVFSNVHHDYPTQKGKDHLKKFIKSLYCISVAVAFPAVQRQRQPISWMDFTQISCTLPVTSPPPESIWV